MGFCNHADRSIDARLAMQRLRSYLGSYGLEVMGQLIMRGTDVAFPTRFQSWSTSSTEDLENIKDR
jgi:hypothetical protein